MTNEEQKEIFCRNFRRYVDSSGKDQKQIANELHYSYTTVNTWYRGKAIPNAAKIQTLADYFGVMKTDLLDDKQNQQNFAFSSFDRRLVSAYHAATTKEQNVVCLTLGIQPEEGHQSTASRMEA